MSKSINIFSPLNKIFFRWLGWCRWINPFWRCLWRRHKTNLQLWTLSDRIHKKVRFKRSHFNSSWRGETLQMYSLWSHFLQTKSLNYPHKRCSWWEKVSMSCLWFQLFKTRLPEKACFESAWGYKADIQMWNLQWT